MICKEFWLETVVVRCSGDQLEFCLGGQKKDLGRSTIRVRGQIICGLDVWWDWWKAEGLEVSTPRLLVHAHGDVRAEG